MTAMMDITGWGYGLSLLWALHTLSVLLFGAGILFLIVLAIRTFTPAQLKTWGLWLAGAGALLCLVTVAVRGGPWVPYGPFATGAVRGCMMDDMGMAGGGRMMDDDDMRMMDRDEDGMMMKRDEGGMMGMSMDDMAGMLEGKTGDAFDEAFLEGMIPHHQGAIDMARAAKRSAKHEEIRAMADQIISAQQREIDQMRSWQRAWGYAE